VAPPSKTKTTECLLQKNTGFSALQFRAIFQLFHSKNKGASWLVACDFHGLENHRQAAAAVHQTAIILKMILKY
jgi:hypothetical protein